MELQTARQIIDTLACGVHPVTGERMPPENPYNEPPVIRALFTVSRALEGAPVRTSRAGAPNTGKPWSAEDDERVCAAFAQGTDVKQVAIEMGRTPFAIESRLVRLGKMPARAGMRMGIAATT